MNIQTPQAPATLARKASKFDIIDCDVHPTLRSPADLKPYMARRWWDLMQTYGSRKRMGLVKGHPYPKSQPGNGARRDAWPPGGGMPGSDLDFMRKQHLDAYGINLGVMNPLWLGNSDQNRDLAAAFASAHNDWQIAKFADLEPRLRPSIAVPAEHAEAAAAEIHRRAADKRFVQVFLLSRSAEALGRPRYWPIFRAAVEHGLPIGIHVFGFSGWAISNTGWPSFYIEEIAEHANSCAAMVTSMIMEGLFEELPELKIILIEAGFSWIPTLGWRLDKLWERMRDEVPHLAHPPSHYLKRHFWVSTQPMDEPEEPSQLVDVFEWIGWDRILFASDYPHWDFDDPFFAIPPSLGDARRRMIYAGNAAKVLRLG